MKNIRIISKKFLLIGITAVFALIAALGATVYAADGETNTIVLENFERFEVGSDIKGYNFIAPQYVSVKNTKEFGRSMHMAAGKMNGMENGERIGDRLTGTLGATIRFKGDPNHPVNLIFGLSAGYSKKPIVNIEDGRLILSDGKPSVSISNTEVNTITFVVNSDTGRIDYYVNGSQVAKKWTMAWVGKWWDGFYVVKNGPAEMYIDGIRIYRGEECETQLTDPGFKNYTSTLAVNQAPHDFAYFHTSDINAGTYKQAHATDFYADSGTTYLMEMNNYHDSFKGDKFILTKNKDSGDNEAYYRVDTYKMGSILFPIWETYPYYVTRGKFTADDTAGLLLSRVDYTPRSGKKIEFEAAHLCEGGYVETSTGIRSEKLNFKDENGEDIYHEIAIYHRIVEKTYDVVLDGKVLALDQPMPDGFRDIDGFASGINAGYGTAKYWKWTNIGLTNEPKRIANENGEVTTIEVTHHSQFPDDDNVVEYLKNRMVFHGEVGRAYYGGQKHDFIGTNKWNKDTKELYITTKDLGAALGSEIVYNGSGSWTAGGKTFIAGEPLMDGDIILAPVSAIAKQLGWYTKGYEYGDMIILSPDTDLPDEGIIDAEPTRYTQYGFTAYESTRIIWNDYPIYILSNAQMVADFVQYQRPTAEQLCEDYIRVTGEGSAHPKILINQEKIDNIKKYLETDPDFQKIWKSGIEGKAKTAMAEDTSKVLLYDPNEWYKGTALKDTAPAGRNFLQRNAALGLMYFVTGDESYALKLKERVLHVSKFTEYSIQKSIDPGFWMSGVAIGLDWAWDFFTEEERRQVVDGIIYAGLEPTDRILDALCAGCHVANYVTKENPTGLFFQYDSFYPKWASNYYPYNMGGVSIACAMVMEVYPQYASEILADVIRGWEYAFKAIYPTGSWSESPAYSDNVGQGMSWGLSSLQDVFGSTYGLDSAPGVEEFAQAGVYQSSWKGAFGWGDCANNNDTQFWHVGAYASFAASHYNRPEYMKWRLLKLEKRPDLTEFIDVLYYVPTAGVDAFAGLDNIYYDENIGMVSIHEDWYDPNASVFFMAGGTAYNYHRHDDTGDFMIINRGECWTHEIGFGNYSAGGNTFVKYLGRSEGHNVITLNPDDDPGFANGINQNTYTYTNTNKLGVAKPIRYEVDEKGGGAVTVFDMTDVYSNHAISRKLRGARISDNYKTFTIRDEITFDEEGDGWWFMHTGAALTQVDDNSIIMTKNGKSMIVTYDCNAKEHSMSIYEPKLLPSSPVVAGDPTNTSDVKKIGIYFKGNGQVDITVRISEFYGTIDTTPIDEWTCPEYSDAAENLDFEYKVYVDGIAAGDPSKVYVMSHTVPEIEVLSQSDDIVIEYEQPKEFDKPYPVRLRSKATGAYFDSSVTLTKAPLLVFADTYDVRLIVDSEVSGVYEDWNHGLLMRDMDIESRWYGANVGDWCMIDTGKSQKVDGFLIAQWKAHERDYYFDLYASNDGENWTSLGSFTTQKSEDYTFYPVSEVNARYFKIVGQGNSANQVGINLREFWPVLKKSTTQKAAE